MYRLEEASRAAGDFQRCRGSVWVLQDIAPLWPRLIHRVLPAFLAMSSPLKKYVAMLEDGSLSPLEKVQKWVR